VASVASCEAASIYLDLVVDEPEVRLYRIEPGDHLRPMEFQERKPVALITRSCGHELCVAADRADWHASIPKVRAHDDPVEVGRLVPTATGLVAIDPGGDQAGSLVVAESVHANTRTTSCLGDGYTLRRNLPGRFRFSKRFDFEHALNPNVAIMRTPRSLRHRDFTLLWSGQTVSLVGDGIFTIALALETLRVSDHATTLAYVQAARIVPSALLLLFAGALVDRLPRRLVVLGADLLRGGAIAAFAALTAAHQLHAADLVLLSVAVGVGDAFFYPAYKAVMPELLPAELLTQGNAFNSASTTVGASLLGPAVGGVIVALGGTSTAFAIDSGTFVVSACCLLFMSRVPAPAPSGRSVASDVRQGIRWTIRQRWLWFGILAVGVANFAAFSPTAVTIPLMVHDVLHQGPVAYGATFGVGGVGGLVAAVIAGRLGSPRRRMSAIWAAWAMASVALVGVGLAPSVVVIAACAAFTYFGITYGNLLWGALMQTVVPAEMLGRVSSVDWLFSICLSPLGIVFAGVLASSIGVRQTVLVGAALAAASCLVVFAPRVRDPDREDYAPVSLSEPATGDLTVVNRTCV
jgi:MFS family permease